MGMKLEGKFECHKILEDLTAGFKIWKILAYAIMNEDRMFC